MTVNAIYNKTQHRPFQFPKRPWTYYQEWNRAIFLHWEISPEQIKPIIPQGLELDVIDGKTWISLVAFDMNNIGIKHLPKLPYVSDFHEINIRIYIKRHGKPSVYFLSMEGSKLLSCQVLKLASKFPYRSSKIYRDDRTFESENKNLKDMLKIEYDVDSAAVSKDSTDLWLTERYAVFQDYKRSMIEYDVHHIEWPMQAISIKQLEVNYPRFGSLLNNNPDRIHYSKGVQVLTWDKRKETITTI